MPLCFEKHKGISIIGQVNFFSNPPYSIRLGLALQEGHNTNSNCLSIIHRSERSSHSFSENILINRFIIVLNKQDASSDLNILDLYELTWKL